MKKYLLLFGLVTLFACGGRTDTLTIDPEKPVVDNNYYINNNTKIAPANIEFTGISQKVLIKVYDNNKEIPSNNFNWKIENEYIAAVNGNEYVYVNSSKIGATSLILTDKKGTKLSAKIVVKPEITDLHEPPYLKLGATREEVIANVNLKHDKDFSQDYRLNFVDSDGNRVFYLFNSKGLHEAGISIYSDSKAMSSMLTQKTIKFRNERYDYVNGFYVDTSNTFKFEIFGKKDYGYWTLKYTLR
ncbi:hypothetical protein CMT52_17500 [Elizabethkingia anophelis]|nr:hypothetical protein [Elizabethkingia anophelis]